MRNLRRSVWGENTFLSKFGTWTGLRAPMMPGEGSNAYERNRGMSGITSGIGLFSGIDSKGIIEQLLAIESRPKQLAQRRILSLKGQQAAYLDLNSKVSALKSAASSFRIGKLFNASKATSSDETVLSATASTNAASGTYNFLVDRLVSSQQLLSKGFASKTSSVNASKITIESAQGRLDRETALADLNGGAGVSRGKIVIADNNGNAATIDLSKAATVSDVLDAINSAEGVNVTATVEGGKFIITHDDGGSLTVKNATGSQTATSLGIEAATLTPGKVTGQTVFKLSDAFSLKALNDGNGVSVNSVVGTTNYDFAISVNGTAVNVNLGVKYDSAGKVLEAATQDVGGVIKRINDALSAAGFNDVKASVNAAGNGLDLIGAGKTLKVTENSTSGTGKTAQELGFTIDTDFSGAINGSRVLAGMNDTLAKNLNGGSGISGGGNIGIVDRAGGIHTISFDPGATLSEILSQFEQDSGGMIKASINDKGTGLVIQDLSGGTGLLEISGPSATALGIETAGITSDTVVGTNLQHKYISEGTTLASLNNGQGLGTGTITVTDTTGKAEKITIGDTITTVGDFIKFFNSRGLSVKARINSQGDGVEIYEDAVAPGSVKVKITDDSGKFAAGLGIAGEAKGTGALNKITGSFEKTVEFQPTDSLEEVVKKFNAAGVGATASIVQDGAGSTPFRLAFTATGTGSQGRFIIDTGTLDLGLSTLDRGEDARVFYGSSDPAKALLVTSSTNTLDKLVPGVQIDLKSVSDKSVKLTVAKDTEKVETAVEAFVETFNTLIERVDALQVYDKDTGTKGALLGDTTVSSLRQSLFNAVQGKGLGITSSIDTLTEVGISIKSGKLEFDSEKFRKAYESDPKAVEDLFAAYEFDPNTTKNLGNGITVSDPLAKPTFTKLGIIGRIEELANAYSNSVDGTLTLRGKTLDNQIELQNKRLTAFDAKLEAKRGILEAQFLAMEKAIGNMQGQQNALLQLG